MSYTVDQTILKVLIINRKWLETGSKTINIAVKGVKILAQSLAYAGLLEDIVDNLYSGKLPQEIGNTVSLVSSSFSCVGVNIRFDFLS